MKAPTEQQLKDPTWWDKRAPDYAASVILVWDNEQKDQLVRIAWAKEKEGIAVGVDQHAEHYHRPTKPAAPEWDGEGLLPVGCECGMTLGLTMYDRVKITYMGDGVFCYWNVRNGVEYTGSLSDAHFVRRRTQAERDREALADLLEPYCRGSYCGNERAVADAIIAAGWRKGEVE